MKSGTVADRRALHEHHFEDHRRYCDDGYTVEQSMKDHPHRYHNMSSVYLHDNTVGMEIFIDEYLNQTHACRVHPSSDQCTSHAYFRRLLGS